MRNTDREESLLEKYNIDHLDVCTRSFAGAYIDGQIYLCQEHIEAFRNYEEGSLGNQNYVSMLHFLGDSESDYGLVCFIDAMSFPPFRKPKYADLIQKILQQVPSISKIYIYKYPNKIYEVYTAKEKISHGNICS